MKVNFRRGVALALVSLVPVVVEAQRRRPPPPDPPKANTCAAPGIRCFFGRANGCTVTCTSGKPVCIGARCILGFPLAAECTCE